MTTIKTARTRILTLPTGATFHFASASSRRFEIAETGRRVIEKNISGDRVAEHPIGPERGAFSGWRTDDLVVDSLLPEGVTFDLYDPSMLPVFKRLAEEAESRGYCSEYDSVAAVVGAPSRADIRALTSTTWVVKVPILTYIEIEVEASNEEDAIFESNNTTYRDAFDDQRTDLVASDWGFYSEPDKTFRARITAAEKG